MASDLFNPHCLHGILLLLGTLMSVISSPVYESLAPVFTELFSLKEEPSVAVQILGFLADFRIGADFEADCLALLQHFYCGFTQLPLFPAAVESILAVDSVLGIVTTDIRVIAGSESSLDSGLKSLLNCYRFLLKNPPVTCSFVNITVPLLPLLPAECLTWLTDAALDPELVNALLPIVLNLFTHNSNVEVIRLCLTFLISQAPKSLLCVASMLDEMIDSWQFPSGEFADTVFRALSIIDCQKAHSQFALISNRLPNLEKNIFVAGISDDFPELNLPAQFPFLCLSPLEKAFKWLTEHPLREWPLRNGKFAAQLAEILVEDRISNVDVSDIDHDQFRFVYRNFSQIDSRDCESFLLANKRWLELEQTAPVTTRRFRIDSSAIAAQPLLATLSLDFKSGRYRLCEPLLMSFFLFSSVKIPFALFREVFDQITSPRLLEAAQGYRQRMNLDSGRSSRILNHPFSFQKHAVLEMCRKISIGDCPSQSIEIFIANCVAQAETQIKPRKLFLVLRLLRLGLIAPQTSDRFPQTVAGFARGLFPQICETGASVLFAEFKKLISQVPSVFADLPPLEFPVFSLHGKIPSRVLPAIREIFLKLPVNLHGLEFYFVRFLSNPIVAQEVFQSVSRYPELVESPDIYFSRLSSALLPAIGHIAPSFLESLATRFPDRLSKFEAFVNTLATQGWSIPNAILFVHSFMSAAKLRAAETKSFLRLCLELFQLNPSVQSAVQLALTLSHFSDFHECLNLLVGDVAQSDAPFVFVLVIAKCLCATGSNHDRQEFASRVVSTPFPFSSRGIAFSLMESEPDTALVFAIADTCDHARLSAITTAYSRVPQTTGRGDLHATRGPSCE
jgi:hypothetical protein